MTKTFRAVLSAYVMLGGLLSVPALIWFFGLLRGLAFDIEFAVAVLAAPLAFSVWLAAFRLEISEETITYRSLFGGVRTAMVADIESIGAARTAPVSKSPLQLEVRLRDGTAFAVNVKPFPREATIMLLSKRPNNARHATCEDARA
jgi:hypothetical protein